MVTIGSLVKHQTMNIVMFIDDLEGDYAVCSWHDGSGLRKERYPVEALKPVWTITEYSTVS